MSSYGWNEKIYDDLIIINLHQYFYIIKCIFFEVLDDKKINDSFKHLFNRSREVRFASFLSVEFITTNSRFYIYYIKSSLNPPEKKLAKRTSVRSLVPLALQFGFLLEGKKRKRTCSPFLKLDCLPCQKFYTTGPKWFWSFKIWENS